MPFASDALAAAVARQTGRQVVIPPNPGTIGALGIALLSADELDLELPALDLHAFLGAELIARDTFACTSTKGCGGGGNLCRIDRMTTRVGGRKQRFLWGGHCSLYDKGTRSNKLPDLTPDPFRQRREMVDALIDRVSERRGLPLVAMSEEFVLKGMLPFFATFVRSLGFDLKILTGAGQKALKRGIECASVPFCAPMQLYHGVIAELLDEEPDILLAPRLRELPRVADEPESVTCPIVQASPEIVARLIAADSRTRVVASRVDMGPGDLRSDAFRDTMRAMARELAPSASWEPAFRAGRLAQERFDGRLADLGRAALNFAQANDVTPVVVLGRTYTLYNDVLNSNVPSLLREQGALAIPVDCYPVHASVPIFEDLFWGYSQVNLRAAHQVRRSDGVYSVFCSNYSCGPDSFNLHFFSYVMENKPFAIIETDGHAGDAGTRTRIEAFLYCVQEDQRLGLERREARPKTSFVDIESDRSTVKQAWDRGELMLLPRMGPSADVMAAALRSEGMRAEALPMPQRSTLRRGREFTSGKECVPMTMTLGSILERLDSEVDQGDRVALFMPTACGPCRFGVYNLLHKIIIEKTGNKEHVRVVSPNSSDYFEGMSTDFRLRVLVAVVASDLLLRARQWTGPVEREAGAAQAIYERWFARLLELVEATQPGNLVPALSELSGKMFGFRELIQQASKEFRSAVGRTGYVPTVSVVGEIYARLDPFTNDFVIDQLEARGIRALLAPMHEWFEYTTFLKQMRIREGRPVAGDNMFGAQVSYALELVVTAELWDIFAGDLGWGERVGVEEAMRAAGPWLNPELRGEAVLTLGTPVAEHLHGDIDGVVAVGPHECMPNKLAEAQFVHVGEELGLTSLTLPLNGDPLDPEVIDRFVFEVKEAFERRRQGLPQHHRPVLADRVRALRTKALAKSLKILRPFGGIA
jgi:predicted nucleotide-binding protein (sugar kinase/HSP70/actin superfamily)